MCLIKHHLLWNQVMKVQYPVFHWNHCWKSSDEWILKKYPQTCVSFQILFIINNTCFNQSFNMNYTENCTMHLSYRLLKKNIFLKPSLLKDLWHRKRGRREETSCRGRIANTAYKKDLQQTQDLNSLNFYFLNFWQYVTFERY